MIKHEEYLLRISDDLSRVQQTVQNRGLLQRYDLHKACERFFCQLLNLIYGYNLQNLNAIKTNYPAIDLGDRVAKLGIQVTAERKKAKVQGTLSAAIKHGVYKDFGNLKIFIVGNKAASYSGLAIPKGITFDPTRDILDVTGLVKELENRDVTVLHSIVKFLNRELTSLDERLNDYGLDQKHDNTHDATRFHVPLSRNRNFTGRGSLIDDLARPTATGTPVVHTLVGLGGVGKTQLAAEYCYRHHDAFDVVWWLRAESDEQLHQDYMLLADSLEMRLPKGGTAIQLTALIRSELEDVKRLLLVFDNASSPEVLRNYLPKRGNSVCIVTSQNPDWTAISAVHDVQVFARSDSIKFLEHRLQSKTNDLFDQLSEELGDLPLALEQAAAYMAATRISPEHYLTLFRSRRDELWKKETAPSDYVGKVGTTWTLSIEKISQSCAVASVMLGIISYLAPDDIPRKLFNIEEHNDAKTVAPKLLHDPLIRHEALATLSRYSLIQLSPDHISVHRLVQLVTRDFLTSKQRHTSASLCYFLLLMSFPEYFITRDARAVSERLAPHVRAAMANTSAMRIDFRLRGAVMNKFGHWLEHYDCFEEAEVVLREAIGIAERNGGKKGHFYAVVANNLANLLRVRGQYRESRTLFEKVIGNVKNEKTTDKGGVAQSYSNYGLLLEELGESRTAEKQHRRAVKLAVARFGAGAPELGLFLNNLGLTLKSLGRYAEALELFQRAFKFEEDGYGVQHPGLITVRNNIGLCLRELKNPKGAITEYHLTLDAAKSWYGESSQIAASLLNNLAAAHADLEELDKAETYAIQAIAADEKLFGDSHIEVAKDLDTLAQIKFKQGKYTEGLVVAVREFRICRASVGPRHNFTLQAAMRAASMRARKQMDELRHENFIFELDGFVVANWFPAKAAKSRPRTP